MRLTYWRLNDGVKPKRRANRQLGSTSERSSYRGASPKTGGVGVTHYRVVRLPRVDEDYFDTD